MVPGQAFSHGGNRSFADAIGQVVWARIQTPAGRDVNDGACVTVLLHDSDGRSAHPKHGFDINGHGLVPIFIRGFQDIAPSYDSGVIHKDI